MGREALIDTGHRNDAKALIACEVGLFFSWSQILRVELNDIMYIIGHLLWFIIDSKWVNLEFYAGLNNLTALLDMAITFHGVAELDVLSN
ncbi:Uncharacterised protein [Corynebacterium kutscheri]|uniref:Uncharacterized protein n=1 Tax=Corynebacterium kutscheri TaxID=35755 RepID=A0A0F6TDH4_9CORY|nr:hypothetical protein [Corynebacterium kutscheri]AKE41189.1 hypothetical protein UL82_05065 [Corynebacterium kutscheri]VEH09511.1 Uncharacterised protein [Corynebacterium kutscheri]VEH79594.1 Uncharacterised protein [Corynebacterium kutscheri]